MRKVRNRKIIGHVAWKSMTAKRSRNVIAVLAIALTTVLFTSLFTISGSIMDKFQEETMRQVGTSSHSGYKYLTWEEYEKVAADQALKDISYRIVLADAENKELVKVRTELSYYEDLDAKMGFCYPETGTMPREKYDIVTSDIVLDALGVKPEIGAKVPLEFTVHGKKYRQEFRLSGWFQGDRISQVQIGCLSREYVTEIAPVAEESAMGKGISVEDFPGYVMADFNFKHSFDLEGQLDRLTKRLGFEQAASGLNWAYMGAEADTETVSLLVSMLLVIAVSGYLIIYNIFYINVFSDIRYYGLLKTIGTTGKQLRKMVRRQAWILSAAGIPAGLLAGVFLGKFLLPRIMSQFSIADSTTTEVSLNFWIFAGAVLFSLVTVHISCIRPCRIAAKVSPVEAVRFTGMEQKKRAGKKGRRTRKVTPLSLAAANMRRSRKKAVVVVLSLSISLVLLNSIYSLVSGFDMDRFVSGKAVSDYMVQDATLDNLSVAYENRVRDGVTEEFLEELDGQEGIEEKGSIYLDVQSHKLSNQEKAWFQERIFKNKEQIFAGYLKMIGEEKGLPYLEELEASRVVASNVYGIDQLLFDKLEIVEGEADWEKFKTGDYVITGCQRAGEDMEEVVPYYLPGEKVTLETPEGTKKEFEVLAVGELPDVVGEPGSMILQADYIIPSEQFLSMYGDTRPMRTLFNVEKREEEKVEAWISGYCENVNPELSFTSKSTIVEEFDSMRNMLLVVGGMLSFILAFIGILNFVNTMVTSILSRRQEFAMVEAVGMTGRQLLWMLVTEGGLYALFTLILSLTAGLLLNVTVIRNMGNVYFFFSWNLTVLPIAVCIPFILAVVAAVPFLCYRNMKKESVVERIRVAD